MSMEMVKNTINQNIIVYFSTSFHMLVALYESREVQSQLKVCCHMIRTISEGKKKSKW